MKLDRALIGALLIGMLALTSSAYGISISVSSNAGGFTENINAGDEDRVFGSTVIGSDRLSNSIEGSGSLKECHSVSNKAGANAGVGVDIRNAERYSYDYYLSPDKASKSAPVMASEELDVLNAEHIQANAQAFNAKGYTAEVSTVIHDPGKQASLIGYRNIAMASKDEAMASQIAEGAFAPNGYIQANSLAGFTQLRSKPLQFREDTADASIRVDSGSAEGYSDLASASAYGVAASQEMDSATGDRIRTKSESESWTASLFQGLKGANAKVSTRAEGTLTGYNASAESSKDYARADQADHIVGTFTSTAVSGKASKTRSSNYGHEYDMDMQARKDAFGSSATGLLGYYVVSDNLVANKIQGAVDASESRDTINVAGGTYFENVQIDKSLSIKGDVGSDPSSETVVDGQMNGSVFTIGKDNPHIKVSLQNVIIQNGSGTYMEKWPGEAPVQFGGGVWNQGTLSIVSSQVSGNTANGYGCGIWSSGNLTVESSSIEGNGKSLDGGGIWSSGNLIVNSSIITGNEAHWNGGGIWNSGNMILENSYVGGNTANLYGGGVANDLGQATVKDSTISGNNATVGGGGVYNIFGTVSLEDSNVSWNNGNAGGGVLNNGEMMVRGGSISNNNAANGGGVFNMGTMELNGALVDNNNATEKGGGVYNEGTAMVMDSTISGNTAYEGSGIFNEGTVIMDGGSITGNNADNYGGGVLNTYWGTVTMNSGNITGNTAAMFGGGVFNDGTVNMNSGSISRNLAQDGGGIFNDGTLNLDGGNITGNTANIDGGGIYNYDHGYGGIVNLNGGSISGNTANLWGGGICNSNNGTVNMNSGSITGNIAQDGGGILNYDEGTVNQDGGNITGNIANNGGGGINNYGTVNLNGGHITGNTADYGGGIDNNYNYVFYPDSHYDYYYGTVNLNGGSITENNATIDGGGIFNNYGSIVTGNLDLVKNNHPNNIVGPI